MAAGNTQLIPEYSICLTHIHMFYAISRAGGEVV